MEPWKQHGEGFRVGLMQVKISRRGGGIYWIWW